MLLLLEALNINSGKNTEDGCKSLEQDRISGAEY